MTYSEAFQQRPTRPTRARSLASKGMLARNGPQIRRQFARHWLLLDRLRKVSPEPIHQDQVP
ncbi:hypothetical protein F4804DRAFT_314068, partial [Jackrogersella minutella]